MRIRFCQLHSELPYVPVAACVLPSYIQTPFVAMAPKAEKKPAKKVAKKVAGGKGKKGKSKVESFKIYIYKVLKQVSCYSAPPGISQLL